MNKLLLMDRIIEQHPEKIDKCEGPTSNYFHTHRIHVWYIELHLTTAHMVDFRAKNIWLIFEPIRDVHLIPNAVGIVSINGTYGGFQK